MAQRINPTVKRLSINKGWDSKWFDFSKYPQFLEEDDLIRKTLQPILKKANFKVVFIERKGNKINIIINTPKPGVIIKHKGEGIDEVKKLIEKSILKFRRKNNFDQEFQVSVNIEETRRPFTNARVVAGEIASALERRMPGRRTIKTMLDKIMANKDVKGAKISISGRIDGVDIARKEWVKAGRMPLNTLRSNIDYANIFALCTFGKIGIKVWIYKGDLLDNKIN